MARRAVAITVCIIVRDHRHRVAHRRKSRRARRSSIAVPLLLQVLEIATLRQVLEIADDEILLLLDHATNHSTVLVDNARCTAPTTDGLPVAVWLCPHCTPTGLRLLLVCRPLGRTGHYRHVGLVIFAVRCCGGRRCGCVPPPWLSTGRRSWVAGQLTDPPRRRGGTLMPDHTAARHGASAARARQRRLEVVEVVVHHFELATRLVV